MTFRVVRISNNLEDYPDCVEDTKEFPLMVQYMEDEMTIFVIDEETGQFSEVSEFFLMNECKRFNIMET